MSQKRFGLSNVLSNQSRVTGKRVSLSRVSLDRFPFPTTTIIIPQFMMVTTVGATETTVGNYKIATFNDSGSFTVSSLGVNPTEGSVVEYLVVAGGAGGGQDASSQAAGGGGGAGGFRAGTGLAITETTYTITVGGGGAARTGQALPAFPLGRGGANGTSSSFGPLISTTGGGGGAALGPGGAGDGAFPGGSGGGGVLAAGAKGTPGIFPSPTVIEGYSGGNGFNRCGNRYAGGGGGAGANGTNAFFSPVLGGRSGNGGVGIFSTITGSNVGYAGGGGGGDYGYFAPGCNTGSIGGAGGGGNGRQDGTANLGGGGGGSKQSNAPATPSGGGGKGVVIIKWRYQ